MKVWELIKELSRCEPGDDVEVTVHVNGADIECYRCEATNIFEPKHETVRIVATHDECETICLDVMVCM
ncbi:MAG: hypothetical protein FWC20_01855 [Oscillospiraceae bacterium]|nr:hypothetical protein [Oscillospiraceae bacterium]MCL2278137.1 hypothetical protein [Oscillospiraceae bacterium]